MPGIAIGLHGGCGTLSASLQTQAEWAESRAHIASALRAGWHVLRGGGTALDAVQASVVVMEDSPYFNAGHGAALTEKAEHELDASIMDGSSLAAGAVCTVRRVRNPVLAARAVLDSGRAVLLSGPAADDFAESHGLAMVVPTYFTTQRRVDALKLLQQRAATGAFVPASEAEKHGTVGAVARDQHGHLAAATSTGGFNNKPSGRVGDSPIIGAGTYARDGVCAVSCTGQGEIFIRRVAAYDLAARMAYGGQTLEAAAKTLVFDTLSSHAVGAGLIALGASGDPVALFNTVGMYRGWITTEGELTVATHEQLHLMGAA
ncbi:MAG: isoaspartyl peptidase/L-asparaginase [Polaromonas sp.]|nr:isoaspartyl peptidase/L-asparaginase [Polaromonas sp.]